MSYKTGHKIIINPDDENYSVLTFLLTNYKKSQELTNVLLHSKTIETLNDAKNALFNTLEEFYPGLKGRGYFIQAIELKIRPGNSAIADAKRLEIIVHKK